MMHPTNSWLWKALVWALLPFTLGAGLPHWECLCAAEKGQSRCECCRGAKLFRSCCSGKTGCLAQKHSESQQPARACCRGKEHDTSMASSKCVKNPLTGGCCRLKMESPVPVHQQTLVVDHGQLLSDVLLADDHSVLITVPDDVEVISVKPSGATLFPSERLASLCRWLI